MRRSSSHGSRRGALGGRLRFPVRYRAVHEGLTGMLDAIDSHESIATEPAFQSAPQAATGSETETLKVHTKHLPGFGGYYLADACMFVCVYLGVYL